jgi:hypothetical protein
MLKQGIGILLLVFSHAVLFSQELDEETAPEYVTDIDMEELRRRILGEDPGELLNFSIKDTNVSLFLTGSWKGTLQGNFGFSNSALGTAFASPETPLLFKQEVDITLSLWINDKWFLEANFLDDYAFNTYRAGYRGGPGDFIKYAGIGNTGLDFPSFPYLDLGGDSPSSFGYYGHMGSGNLDIHTLIRYDNAAREEKIFTGGRERTYAFVQPQNSVRGTSFVLPDRNITSDITVYIEDINGTLRDSGGRRWRIAQPAEYAAGRAEGLLELYIRPQGLVAVSYSGRYSTEAYLADVQAWFSGIDLSKYPQCGYTLNINGDNALVIYENGSFSPFERLNRYDAPSSTSEQAALIRLSTGNPVSGFELIQLDLNPVSDIPLYTAASASRRNVYELLSAAYGSGRRSPQTLWPLARDYPEIYLPGSNVYTGDTALRFTNFSNAAGYFIGTDVVSGSVQVWRSGIQDSNFSFNPSSGEVTLLSPVGYSEIVRITYLKRTNESRLGSIAAGLGAVYRNGESPFSAQAALGIRWNLTDNSAYTEYGQSSMGSVGLSFKTALDYNNLKTQITAGMAFEQTDTTGLYRAAGMEGNEIILFLPYSVSFVSNPPASKIADDLGISMNINNRAPLIYRNYYYNNVLGSSLMSVEWSGASIVSSLSQPYPVKDPQLDAAGLAAEFVLNDSRFWTGFQIPLDYGSSFLSRASQIIIPFRLFEFSGDTSKLRIIIQIGSLSGKDYPYSENLDLILEREIFDGGADVMDNSLRYYTFNLNEEDRFKLGNAEYMRLIAVYEGSGGDVTGRVLLSPPVVHGSGFRAVTSNNNVISGIRDLTGTNRVTAFETADASLERAYASIIRRVHPSGAAQRVLKISWENMDMGVSAGVDTRINSLPLDNYSELSFFVKGPDFTAETLSFYAAPGPDSLSNSSLEAHIPLEAFNPGQWSKVTIRYQGGSTGVFVNEIKAAGARYYYRRTAETRDIANNGTSYIAFLVNPQTPSSILGDAALSIDEIILEDPAALYRINAGFAFEYSKPGILLSAGGVSVLSDFSFTTAMESEFRINSAENNSDISSGVTSRTGMEFSFLGAKITGNFFFTAARDTFLWSADHDISKKFALFSFREAFYASPYDNSVRHILNLAFLHDFYAKFDAQADYEFSKLRQRWNFSTGYNPKYDYIPSLSLNYEAAWTNNADVNINDGYAKLWLDTWEPMVPDAGEGAQARRTEAHIIVTQGTKPVGAVLTMEGSTNFSGVNSLTQSENSIFLGVPVSIDRYSLNFRLGRSFKRHIFYSGGSIFNDGNKFFESVSEMSAIWGVFPVYSLFTGKLDDAMNEVISGSPSADLARYTSVNEHLSVRMNLPPVYNPLSFIIPAGFSLSLERLLEQKLDTRSDVLNLGASINFSAVNMFGAMGYKRVFSFYQTDEFSHSVQALFLFPKNESASWRIQSVLGLGFRGFSGGELNFTNTLTLYNGASWLESFTADWTVPTENSLLSMFYDWITGALRNQSTMAGISSLFNMEYEQLRKETLELVFDRTEEKMRWSAAIGHESIIRILGRLDFSTFIKLRFNNDLNTNAFIFDVLLGTSLRVSF